MRARSECHADGLSKRLSLIALVAVLGAPALAPVASATSSCPGSAIVSPSAGSVVVAVGSVPVTLHTCWQFNYILRVKDSNGVQLGAASGLVAAPCGHGDTSRIVAWGGAYAGPATVELTTTSCASGVAPKTVSIMLVKV